MDHINKHNLLHNQTIDVGDFTALLQSLLLQLHYSTRLQDIDIAWRIVSREQSVCILLGGTSGSGKSTLASLLAQRIGITSVIATDHIRSLLRSFDPEKKSNVLWASSYHAGESLQHESVPERAIIRGYEAQCKLMLDTLSKMISTFYDRNESLVIEGVGLSIESMRTLAKTHPYCIPLMIYISNKQKHAERFAVRAKYMTTTPRSNKYIHYFGNIRSIQQHLCKEADRWLVPKIDNTNVDRSLAILHTTMMNVLSRMRDANQTITIDTATGKLTTVYEEFSLVCCSTWSSKQMLRRIRQRSSSSKLNKESNEEEKSPLKACESDGTARSVPECNSASDQDHEGCNK